MPTLPQLLEEDILRLDDVLRNFLERSEATTALVIDKGGFLITQVGAPRGFDTTTLAALSAAAFAATESIASLVSENNFSSVYQQGEKFSMFVVCVDENCLLAVIFKAHLSVGAVKYFAGPAAQRIAAQMQVAQERDPGAGLDLSVLNIADASAVFKKKS